VTVAYFILLFGSFFLLWAALLVQIRRIDRLEYRMSVEASRHKFHNDWLRTITDEVGRLDRSSEGKRIPAKAAGSPGDVHPFAPDAYITVKDLL
jgi:hypothetical protein